MRGPETVPLWRCPSTCGSVRPILVFLVYRRRMNTLDLLIHKDKLQIIEARETGQAPLAEGQVRLRIDKFALTSNNITYAAFGNALNYWQFFPVAEAAWGIIPVWGFADVVQSACAGISVGERFYGYFPMASHVVLEPTRVTAASFTDGAAHRSALHGIYNQYLKCSTDPLYTPDTEDIQALLRPLFTTACLIDDFMADNQFFGAQAAASSSSSSSRGVAFLSSASSKTAYSTAFGLKQRQGIEVVGLTSPGNVAFCESLGCYDRVLTYDQLDAVPADQPCVYVDFAGNGTLRLAIHTRFTNLKYSCSIGGTHVTQLAGARNLPGPRATLFFAPDQIKKRAADWGPDVFRTRITQAWFAFTAEAANPAHPWIKVQHHTGQAQVSDAYALVLGGRGDPRLGHMLSLQ